MGIEFSNTFSDITIDTQKLREVIRESLPSESNVMVYAVESRKHQFSLNGNGNRLTIIIDATPSRTEGYSERNNIVVGGAPIEFGKNIRTMPKITRGINNIVSILDDVGEQILHYDEQQNALYIPYKLMDLSNTPDVLVAVFKGMLDTYRTKVVDVRHLRYSWLQSPDKESLTETFKARLQGQALATVSEDKRSLSNAEEMIVEYMRKLKREHDKTIRLRKSIEVGEETSQNAVGKLLRDLDLIVQHPSFEDVRIKDGRITLITDEIYAWTKQDKRYHIGKFEIDVKMENTEVKFRGNNPRRSYWSHSDPHPHVSSAGNACLGNVGGSIAELSSQSELYALALVLLDYLQNVNIEDVAGKFILNWDEVDEDGKVIKKGYINGPGGMRGPESEDSERACQRCGDTHDTNNHDFHSIGTGHDFDGDVDEYQTWCTACHENHSVYNEHEDGPVSNDVHEALEEYHEGD